MRTSIGAAIVCLLFGLLLAAAPPAFAAAGGKGKDKGKTEKTEEETEEGKDKGKGHGKPEHAGKSDETPKGPADRPPGWDKGKKAGWENEYPPGWDKKTDEEKALWRKDVQEGKDEVQKAAEAKGLDDAEKAKLQEAFERISRKGKEVPAVKSDLLDAVKQGKHAVDVLKDNGLTVEF